MLKQESGEVDMDKTKEERNEIDALKGKIRYTSYIYSEYEEVLLKIKLKLT